MVLETPGKVHLRLTGPMGARVQANVEHWLLSAPVANPGMIEMFRLRDRRPRPDLVPWAGEFVGKYLLSAVQACRMTDDPRLEPFVAQVVADLLSTQADDGYLGPFTREERLLGHWDLWGHYHALRALLAWHADTGDEKALAGARRAADLVCRTFLDTERRVWDAGSHEMNMAIAHGLGLLYQATGEDRYLRMVHEVVEDWQRPPAGDYLRTGLAGVDFYRTPKPRWESLHCLQALTELYRITGDDKYRRAFVQHWTSIRDYDRHPSGGFTTGEQAIGNPYSDGAIETCCTIAWMDLSLDMLRLTGDPAGADELELATWNGMLGSQHPSGRWWTYNTPMDGVRQASAHTIVFQARHGTPELNCCSVNGPRGLGMLSEWGVMTDPPGSRAECPRVTVNYYGPCRARVELPDGTALVLAQETRYPADAYVRMSLRAPAETELALRLRIPAWSRDTRVRVNAEDVEGVWPGSYLTIERAWKPGDVVELRLDFSPRYWTGELARTGCAAVYRGPLLLAFDRAFNEMDTPDLPALDLSRLRFEPTEAKRRFRPLLLVKCPTADGDQVLLCDFATAGAHGTDYRAWLPAVKAAPAPFHLKRPRDGDMIPAGPALFEWTGYRSAAAAGRTFRLEVAEDEGLARVVARRERLPGTRAVVENGLRARVTYFWRVVAVNEHGETLSASGPWSFTTDPDLPNRVGDEAAAEQEPGPGGVMLVACLAGSAEPDFGILETALALEPAAGRSGAEGGALRFDGLTSKLTYRVPYFPAEDYTALAWVCPEGLPTEGRYQQVFSAWAAPMDDPLRIVLDGDRVFARIEARQVYGTEGVPLENGRWVHVAAVKQGEELRLYVDGKPVGEARAPAWVYSGALNVGVGCNPNYAGNERLIGRIARVALYARALSPEEIADAAARSGN